MRGHLCGYTVAFSIRPVPSIPCESGAYFDSSDTSNFRVEISLSSEGGVRQFVSLLQYESDGCVGGLV